MANNNENKVLNVPNLRFPEFTGEWEKKKMKDVCTFYSGGTPTSSNKDYYSGDIPFIRSGELHERSTELFISEDGLNNSSAKMVYKGDLLLALYGATSGDIAISQIEGAINQAILCINTQHSKEYIKAIWQKHVQKILQTYLQGGQGNLSADIVKNISFYFASSKEQGKLANFIRLLDERITTQNKIIEDLKKLKSAISLNVLHSDTWEQFKIKDIAKIGRGRVISWKEISQQKNPTYPVYSSQTSNDGIMGYLDDYMFEGEYISWTTDGANAGTVFYRNGKFNCTNVCGLLKLRKDFDAHSVSLVLAEATKKYVSTNLANPKLMNNTMGNIQIRLPKLEEQKRISIVFRVLQGLWTVHNSLLTEYTKQKQYLLSQMFI